MPLQIAFCYWMCRGEFSADRAAMLCDGSADRMVEVCMRLPGPDRDIDAQANMEEFMERGRDYRGTVKDSAWNRTFEFMRLSRAAHPLMAVRALACSEWARAQAFQSLIGGAGAKALPEAPAAGDKSPKGEPFDFGGIFKP